MGENIQLYWGVSRVESSTLDLLEDEERQCLDISILQASVLRQMAYPWVKMPNRLVESHVDYQTVVEMPVAYLEALEELEILLSGAYDGPTGGCPVGEEFVDRGDPSGWDITHADLAVDGAWHSYDLGAWITDADATRVEIDLVIRDDLAGQDFVLRQTNNVNVRNRLYTRTAVANQWAYANGYVSLGPDRSIDYMASSGMNEICISVRGWWKPAG